MRDALYAKLYREFVPLSLVFAAISSAASEHPLFVFFNACVCVLLHGFSVQYITLRCKQNNISVGTCDIMKIVISIVANSMVVYLFDKEPCNGFHILSCIISTLHVGIDRGMQIGNVFNTR
jgi:hypothetical protein